MARFHRAAMALAAAVLAALSLAGIVFFLGQNTHLLGNDHIYYLSIAESWLEHGALENRTVYPPQPVATPQNGVVAIYAALFAVGFDREGAIIALVVLGYLLHLCSLIPLSRILRRAGLREDLPRWTVLAVYAVGWQFVSVTLTPANDALFNPLAIWLLDLLLRCEKDFSRGPREMKWGQLLAPALLAAVLVHFRLHAILLSAPVAAAFVLTRSYARAVPAAVATLAAVVSLAIPYSQLDRSGLANTTTFYTRDAVGATVNPKPPLVRLFEKTWQWCNETIPELLFANAGIPGNLIYGVFALALTFGLAEAYRRRDSTSLALALVCIAGLVLGIIFLRHRTRYVVYLAPYLYLFLLRPPRFRTIGYLFASLVIFASALRYAVDIPRSPRMQHWLHLRASEVELGVEKPLLVTDHDRYPYFFLGAPQWRPRELSLEPILEHGGLFLVGRRWWAEDVAAQIEDLASEAGYTFEQRRVVPDFEVGRRGYSLFELHDFVPRENAGSENAGSVP